MPEHFEQLYQFDFLKNRWSIVQYKGQVPKGTEGHQMVSYQDSKKEWHKTSILTPLLFQEIFLFGGHNGVYFFNCTHVYDITDSTWYKLPLHPFNPAERLVMKAPFFADHAFFPFFLKSVLHF